MYTENFKQYKKWHKDNEVVSLTPLEGKRQDGILRKILAKELEELSSVSINEYYLVHKHQEVQDFINKVGIDKINEIKNLLYQPTDFDDYKNIEPELIHIHEGVDVLHTNIYGESSIRQLSHSDDLELHWQTIRTLVSSSRNDSTLGRIIRFLVKDKVSGKYLGIIGLGSGLPTITNLNKECEWDIKKEFSTGGRILHTANGQSIIPTQPAGRLFQMGKLLALLCLSKPVCEKYEELYDQKLVSVHTTSLYGDKGISQYDNLKHFKNLGLTAGSSALKISNKTFSMMIDWLRVRYPYEFWTHREEKNIRGFVRMRDRKNRLLITVFQKLGFKKSSYESGHKRLVYNSFLFTNSKEFLCRKIEDKELIEAYDNSVGALTHYWKYGDDLTELQREELNVRYKTKSERLNTVIRMRTGVSGHVENLRKNHITLSSNVDEWYGDVYNKSFQKMKSKFMKEVGR